MLSKQKRLSGADITQLWKGGKPTGTPFFVVRHIKTDETSSRFAVIAPKTIAKSAVLRNSIRRKWYASLRQALKNKALMPGIYAFVIKKEGILAMPQERMQSLEAFFTRIK